MLRRLLIGIGVLVGLLVVAALALVLFVDVNRFKPEIERQVKDRYDRTLAIDGSLSLKLFPRVAVALPKTTLSEHASEKRFASIEAARVSVAVLPLLSGRIEADRIAIEGLTATIVRHKDGSTNLDDLLAPGPGEPAAPTPTAPAGGPPAFEIGGVTLHDARLAYVDEAAGNTISIAPLNLTTGRLANQGRTPVEVSAQFSATQPAAQGAVQLKTTLDLDLAKRAFGAADLVAALQLTQQKNTIDLTATAGQASFDARGGSFGVQQLDLKAHGAFADVQLDDAHVVAPALAFDPQRKVVSVGGLEVFAKGRRGPDSFDATVSAPKLEASAEHAAGDRVLIGVKLAGTRTADLKLTLEGFGGNARKLDIARLALALDLREGERHVAASIASPVTASLDDRTLTLAKLVGELSVEDPALPMKLLKLPLAATLSVDARKETVDGHFSTKVEDSTLAADFDVRGFGPVALRFDASADRLNLDRYAPPPAPAPGNDSADPKVDPKVDLTALQALNLDGQLRVGQLQARGLKVQNLLVQLKAAGGKLDVAPLTAALYGGAVNAHAHLDAGGNKVAFAGALNNIAIQPLLKDAADKDLLDGRGNVKFDLATAGATVGTMKRALDGSASISLRDGAIKGINLAQKLRDAQNLLGRGQDENRALNATEKTDFSEFSATFAIKDGVAVNDDLDVKSPLLRVGGAGRADIGAGTLDYTARVSVVGTLKGQDGRDLTALRGVTVPVRLQGPFEKPTYGIDWSGVAEQALKSRAAEQLKEKVTPQIKAQRDKLKEGARDALKGLFKP